VLAPPGSTTVYVAQGGENENGELAPTLNQLKQALQISELPSSRSRPEHVVKITTLVVEHNEFNYSIWALK